MELELELELEWGLALELTSASELASGQSPLARSNRRLRGMLTR